MRKIIVLLIFGLITMNCLAGDDDVRLDLWRRDTYVVVTIENLSPKTIKVSDLFTQNPSYGLIGFNIFSGNRRFGLVASPNEDLPNESSYLILKPFKTYGQIFYIEDIRRWYGVVKNCFSMSVTYHDVLSDKFYSVPQIRESNKIDICQ